MLALAILTQFSYSWNQGKSHTQAKKGAIPPTISPNGKETQDSSAKTGKGEAFGIGINQKKYLAEENERKKV